MKQQRGVTITGMLLVSLVLVLVLLVGFKVVPFYLEYNTIKKNFKAMAEDPALQDMAEDQKRRAAERLQKLRNLSFNVNAADPNNEFEAVPAYIRRNMELFNNSNSVENFYSNYTVKPDGEKTAQISTINTFLDGKKPD